MAGLFSMRPLRGLGGSRFISEVLGKKAGLISNDQLAGSLRGADETRPPVMSGVAHETLRRLKPATQ
jgi:hypothetical protein